MLPQQPAKKVDNFERIPTKLPAHVHDEHQDIVSPKSDENQQTVPQLLADFERLEKLECDVSEPDRDDKTPDYKAHSDLSGVRGKAHCACDSAQEDSADRPHLHNLLNVHGIPLSILYNLTCQVIP